MLDAGAMQALTELKDRFEGAGSAFVPGLIARAGAVLPPA